MNKRLAAQLLGVWALAAAIFFAFLQRPGLGDDFTYWKVGFEISSGLSEGWRADSFHDLRWPIWGLCWLLDQLGGAGLISYYGVPFLYLSVGAIIAFLLGRRVLGDDRLGWVTAAIFLFSPLLDPVAYRPMPDLAEGVWGAGVVLAWHAAMTAATRGRLVGYALISGGLVAVAHANRFTGLLLVPVLIFMTAILFPKRWPRLLLILGAAGGAIGAECLVYQHLTGDFWHSVHRNLGARGKKGTEAINPLLLPFRFLDTLWRGRALEPLYLLFSLLGGGLIWWKASPLGRTVVAWGVLAYLGYSCALQQLWPPRPMLRDADRFLCALAIPMAVMIAGGAAWTWAQLRQRPALRAQSLVAWCEQRPRVAALLGLALLVALSPRPFFNLDYVPEFRHYLATRPPGTKVLTHESMWNFCHLINIKAARQIDFLKTGGETPKSNFLDRAPDLETAATTSDEFWFSRKLALLRSRKDLLYKGKSAQPALASYLDTPERGWRCAELIYEGDKPEFVFYQKQKPEQPPPLVLPASALGLALPQTWDRQQRKLTLTFPVPATLRGQRVRVRVEIASNSVQAVNVWADFLQGQRVLSSVNFIPQFYPQNAVDFVNFEMPAAAEQCVLKLEIAKEVKTLTLNALEIVVN